MEQGILTLDELIELAKTESKNNIGIPKKEVWQQIADCLTDYKRLRSIPEHNNDNCPNLTCRSIERERGYNKCIEHCIDAIEALRSNKEVKDENRR